MRTNLKVFRIKQKLNQAEMADKIGVSRQVYCYMENGKSKGNNIAFWNMLQKAFNIPDEDMFSLMKLDNE